MPTLRPLPLLLLAGCTAGTWYPAVFVPPQPPDTGPVDTAEEGLPCTPLTGPWPPADVHATNLYPGALLLWWRGADCVESFLGDVPEGNDWVFASNVGYVFVVRTSEGDYVDHLVVADGENAWEIE